MGAWVFPRPCKVVLDRDLDLIRDANQQAIGQLYCLHYTLQLPWKRRRNLWRISTLPLREGVLNGRPNPYSPLPYVLDYVDALFYVVTTCCFKSCSQYRSWRERISSIQLASLPCSNSTICIMYQGVSWHPVLTLLDYGLQSDASPHNYGRLNIQQDPLIYTSCTAQVQESELSSLAYSSLNVLVLPEHTDGSCMHALSHPW